MFKVNRIHPLPRTKSKLQTGIRQPTSRCKQISYVLVTNIGNYYYTDLHSLLLILFCNMLKNPKLSYYIEEVTIFTKNTPILDMLQYSNDGSEKMPDSSSEFRRQKSIFSNTLKKVVSIYVSGMDFLLDCHEDKGTFIQKTLNTLQNGIIPEYLDVLVTKTFNGQILS